MRIYDNTVWFSYTHEIEYTPEQEEKFSGINLDYVSKILLFARHRNRKARDAAVLEWKQKLEDARMTDSDALKWITKYFDKKKPPSLASSEILPF